MGTVESPLPPIKLRRVDDLTLEAFTEIAWDGRIVALDNELLDSLAVARRAMEAALTEGASVYGVNTGMGYLATVRLTAAEEDTHGANLFFGRAVGGPPFLPWNEVRAVLLARLASFLSGHAGVTPSLCSYLADRLNDGFVPAIPRTEVGCAGEIIPLSHAFGTFLGLGSVINPEGGVLDAASVLAERGIQPYGIESKEGIALLAGAPGALALAIARHRTVAVLARQIVVCWACVVDAMSAPLSPFDPGIAALSRDPVMAEICSRFGTLLAGSTEDRRVTQAPVSFRVIPQLLTHLQRTLDRLEEDVRRGLPATTDSPAFFNGRFLTNGGFHAVGLAAHMDALCIALVQVAELASQHVHRALDSRFSGLPDQLTPTPGPQAGLVVVHKRMVGAVHTLRRLAMPASVGIVDTSMGQEDAMSFGFEAAEKLREAEYLVCDVLACELIVCRQAWALRGTKPAAGLQDSADELTRHIEPIHTDRQLGAEIDALADLLRAGALQYNPTRPRPAV